MIIIRSRKTIFIHIHRTGGTSITSLLKRALPNQVDVIAQHGNASTMEKKILEEYPDYFVFSIVRNPWDRLLSWYSLLYKSDPKDLETERVRFEEFLINTAHDDGNDSFLLNQIDYFKSTTFHPDRVTIYRFENYEEEVKKIAARLQITIQETPRINETLTKDYKKYYTEKGKALVDQKCARDIAYFGYSF